MHKSMVSYDTIKKNQKLTDFHELKGIIKAEEFSRLPKKLRAENFERELPLTQFYD